MNRIKFEVTGNVQGLLLVVKTDL